MNAFRVDAANLTRITKDTNGTAAIEFAIILPLFLSFMLGVIEVAQAVYSQGVMRYAIQEVSRTIMVDSSLSASQVETAVTDKLDGLNAADILSVTATLVDNLDMTETLTLEVSYKYDFEVPLVTTIPLIFDSKTEILREMAPAP